MFRCHLGRHRDRHHTHDYPERSIRSKQHRPSDGDRKPITWSPDGHRHVLRLWADGHSHRLHVSVRPGRKFRGLDRGAGDTSSATSGFFTPDQPGYWCFAGYYSGDSNYNPSSDTSTDECFDVTSANTTTATAPTVSDIAFGASDTDQATVTGNPSLGPPTGTVTFYVCGPTATPTACTSQSDQVGSPVGLTAGAGDTSSATSSSFTPTATGYWCFAGYYSGDSNYNPSSDASTDECFDVTPANTTTATAPTVSDIALGASDTDQAAVTGNSAGGSPTGTVTFYVCGPAATPTACTSQSDQVGSPVGLTAGTGDTSSATSSSFTPTATGYWCFAGYYSGDSNYNPSSDASTDECFDVTPADTTTATLPTTTPSVQFGQSNTDQATVTGNSAGGSPTGTVTFYVCGPTATPTACTSQSDQVGSPVGLTAGAGDTSSATSSSFTPTATGYWCFAGYYSGDSNYNPSSDASTDECFDVTPADTTTATLPTTTPSVQFGQSNTDQATVTGNSAGGSPTGSVTFYVCGPTATPTACTSQSDQVGSSVGLTAGAGDTSSATSSSFTPTATGYWCFAGYYSGDSNYNPSSDASIDECFDVTPADTTTATKPTDSSIVGGTSNTDQATVTGNPSLGPPTGTVTFYVCGPTATPTDCTSQSDQVGSPVGLTAGAGDTSSATSASFTPDQPGYWCFAGYYSGDSNYNPSSDASIDECFDVTPVPPMPSKTVTDPHESDIQVDRYNYDTAYVKGNATGGPPTGTVTFDVCGPTPSPVGCKSTADQLGSPVPLTPGNGDALFGRLGKVQPRDDRLLLLCRVLLGQ